MHKIYYKICKIYTLVSKVFEKLFLFNKKKYFPEINSLKKDGYCLETFGNPLVRFDKDCQEIKVNKYMLKLLVDKSDIHKLIYDLFIHNNLKNIISSSTGMNYSIDYFIAYKNLPIATNELDGAWYANHWHYDRPFSSNTLKIIIPINEISKISHGGIALLNKQNSQNFINHQNKISPDYQMIANTNDALIFYPNICMHKAGLISDQHYTRCQIMFQLNPSLKWRVNSNIALKQKKIEPKFPFFSYFFDKYTQLENIKIN